jgi:hypothetical protein
MQMPMINGIPIPYGDDSMLGQNYGLLGDAMPAGMGVTSPLAQAQAALLSNLTIPSINPVNRVTVPLPAAPPPVPLGAGAGMGGAGAPPTGTGGKPQRPLFWGEDAAFPETGEKISGGLQNAWQNLFSNIGGFFGGGGSQFPNWTGGGTAPLNQVPYTGFTLPTFR